jgi:membrane-associated phospholipid phosphatase
MVVISSIQHRSTTLEASNHRQAFTNQSMLDRRLLLRSAWSLLVCAAVGVLCYQFVDWRVAQWVHREGLGKQYPALKWPTYLGWWLEAGSLVIICSIVVGRVFAPWQRWQRVLLAAAISVTVASGIAEQVKVVFGRPWPETWRKDQQGNDNSSYIRDGDYDFRWFDGSDSYGSFPSGHTTIICAAMSVVWIAWPKARWLAALLVAAVVVGLVGNNYHFVGDTVAGGLLGALTGMWSCAVFGLSPDQKS